jgi:CHAT domain-containing protein
MQEARALFQDLHDVNSEAAALDRLGTLLRETGDFAGALRAYRDSYAISEATDNPVDIANTAGNIGCLLQEWGRTEEALAELAASRDRLLTLDDPKALSHVEFCLARAERQRGNLGAALGHLERSLAIVDEIRDAARRLGARYRPIWLWQDYSELHHELLMAEYRATDDDRFAVRAFEASDLARSRNLFELVLESRVGVRATAGKALLGREREVQERLNAVEKRLRELRSKESAAGQVASGPDTGVADLERQLRELSLELEWARAKIRAADPRYAELAAPQPVHVDELRALLAPGTALLSYKLGAERSYLFVISRAAFRAWSLDARPQIDAHTEALYRALQQSRFDPFQHELAAQALGRMLLPQGSVPTGASRLLVVAEGLLNYLPLGVLPSPMWEPDGGEGRLLADDFEIHHLASASLLTALRHRGARERRTAKTVAVFADGVFSAADPRLGMEASGTTADASPPTPGVTRSISVEQIAKGRLPRLPFTRSEAEAILALVPEEKRLGALGFAASKRTVMDGDLDQYRIVHFATHAHIDEQFPELSSLVLSRLDRQGKPVDGDLHLHEIYGLKLAAELVVLSGCQTALGRQVRGDGLLGLTRGFLYAGSSQVLVSLWSVDDEATAALMSEFYTGLLEREESPAVALRSAQQWMRRQDRWRAPYFWAAFVLQSAGS